MEKKHSGKKTKLLLYCCQKNLCASILEVASNDLSFQETLLFYILEQISNNYFGSIFIIPIFDSYHFHQCLPFSVPKACFAISIAFLCGQYDFFAICPTSSYHCWEPLNSTTPTRPSIRTGTLLYTQWVYQFLAIQTQTASIHWGMILITLAWLLFNWTSSVYWWYHIQNWCMISPMGFILMGERMLNPVAPRVRGH